MDPAANVVGDDYNFIGDSSATTGDGFVDVGVLGPQRKLAGGPMGKIDFNVIEFPDIPELGGILIGQHSLLPKVKEPKPDRIDMEAVGGFA